MPEVRTLRGLLGNASDPSRGRTDDAHLPMREVSTHLAGILSPATNPGNLITGDRISEGIPGERGLFEGKVKAEVLKEVVDVVSTLVDDAKLTVGKDSITVKAVDPAHVAMVDLSLDRGAFEAYKADECELGVDMDKMKEILRLAKGGETISFSHDEDKNRLVVTVGNTTRRMALVDTAGMSDPKVPSLNLPAKLVVRTDELRQAIRASESISDHIALKASPDGFEIVSEGDTDNVSHMVPKDLLEELQAKEAVRSLFPLDYFSNMVKAISSAPTVTLYLGSDYPVKIEFKI